MLIQISKEKAKQWEQADPPYPEEACIWYERIEMLEAAAEQDRKKNFERQGDPEDLSGLDFELPNPNDCDEEASDEI